MAYDFVAIHVHLGPEGAQADLRATLSHHLQVGGYEPVAEADLNPYRPALNLGQATRSLYLGQPTAGWLTIVDEDGFRLDEATAEGLLAALSAHGPAILLWSIDQYVWGYTIAQAGAVVDRYTEDWIELEAYSPYLLHRPDLTVEQQGPRYRGDVAALAGFLAAVAAAQPAVVADNAINSYRAFFRRTLDNENDYMDALISGEGEIYADSWAKQLAASLAITEPTITYLDLVRAEQNGALVGWQPLTMRRPAQHQPAYSVGLTLYCRQPLSYRQMVDTILLLTQSLPAGGSGWHELELLGTYYKDESELIDGLLHEELTAGERLNLRYYPGCNLTIQRASDEVPLDVVLVEYPSIFDDQYTAAVLQRAFEVQALFDFVQSPHLSQLASDLFAATKAAYGYISVLGGGAGGDGGGRVNVPGAILREANAQTNSQLLTRVGAAEAASWRARWARAGEVVRAVYWANLLDPQRQDEDYLQVVIAAAPGFPVLHASCLNLQLPVALRDYAEGTSESRTAVEQMRQAIIRLLEEQDAGR